MKPVSNHYHNFNYTHYRLLMASLITLTCMVSILSLYSLNVNLFTPQQFVQVDGEFNESMVYNVLFTSPFLPGLISVIGIVSVIFLSIHVPYPLQSFITNELMILTKKQYPNYFSRTKSFSLYPPANKQSAIMFIKITPRIGIFALREPKTRFTITAPCPSTTAPCSHLAQLSGFEYHPQTQTLHSECTEEEFRWRIWQLITLYGN